MSTPPDVARSLGPSLDADPSEVRSLHERLAVAADEAGLLDIAYTTVDSPLGSLLLAATARGLVRVAFAAEDHTRVLDTLSARISPRILRHPARLDVVVRQLDEYFTGERRGFELDLDWRLSAGFRATVLHQLPTIDYGSTASYATLARLAGRPKAVRAAGTACATNPLPIVVPCHRVVKSDGSLGNYLAGPEAKATLLELEAAA